MAAPEGSSEGAATRASVSAAIVAGGRATRLGGACKALLEVGGRTILDRTRDALAPLANEVILVGDPAQLAGLGLPVIADRRPGLGPMAGLEAALEAIHDDTLLLLGGDMPFLDTAMLRRLLDADPGADAVCFESERGAEPLCARYARRILPRVRALLDEGRPAMHALLGELAAVRLRPASEAERRALANINTPADLEAARLLARSLDRARTR